MDKVYVVCWSNSTQDDDGAAQAFCGVFGVYRFIDDAKAGLEECKEDFIEETVNNPDFSEEDREYAASHLQIYGSTEDDYFEIDYATGDTTSQLYMHIVEKEIKG